MKILLTNDDGIESEGLNVLVKVLRCTGHRVFVIAPDANRSGISHALSVFNSAIKLYPKEEDTWSFSGTPADCVIAGLKGKFFDVPDLVLSGINQGENLGTDIIYSGTAGAARQASLMGIPGIALSLSGWSGYHWDMSAAWVADHLEELYSLWREHAYLNVNIPNSAGGPSGIQMTWPAAKHYNDTFSVKYVPGGEIVCKLEGGEAAATEETGSDCDVVSRNLVSVSVLYNFPAVRRDLCPGVPDYASVAPRNGS